MKKWLDDLYAIILKRGCKTLDDLLKNYENNENLINNNKYNLIDTYTFEPGATHNIDLSEIGVSGNRFFSVLGYSNNPAWFITRTFKQYWVSNFIPISPSSTSGFDVSFTSEKILTVTNITSSTLTVKFYYVYSPYNQI